MVPLNAIFQNLSVRLFALLQNGGGPSFELPAGKSLLITSARPGEGKTSIAEAISFYAAAITPYRILLVDANPERPRIHVRFDLPNRSGFSDGLLTRQWDHLAFQAGTLPNLTILPAGTSPPGLLFKHQPLTEFLQCMSTRFDLIILDGSTIGMGGYANQLAKLVDGVILVVDATRTRREVVHHALSTINADKNRILGVILNRQPHYIPRFIYSRL